MPLRAPSMQLGLAQDDFYYYLKTARSLAWFHHASAFQNVRTNGYHPLYFLLLTVVSLSVKTIPGIYRFLWALDTLSAVGIFLITRRIFGYIASTLLANALAIVITSLCLIQICFQMEVTLALPIGLGFLLAGFIPPEQLTERRAALIGLLGAFTFLARLDAGLLVVLWVLAAVCSREYRRAMHPGTIASFLTGCLPLPLLYLWINHHFFGTLLPISSMAKQLRRGIAPSLLLFRTFAEANELLVVALVATAVLAYALRRHLAAREKVFLFATLGHPFVFYGLETLVSDWPVWPWYFYSLRFSAVGSALIVCIAAHRSEFVQTRLQLRNATFRTGLSFVLLLVACAWLFTAKYHVDPWMLEIQRAAGVLDRFAKAHPGVYAMGDRGGMFMATTASPVLQTEGLLMDRTYLEHLRAQDDLRTVLSSYGVNYYVVFIPEIRYKMQLSQGCFHAMEPLLAGSLSMRMRSDFCEQPIFRFSGFDGFYAVYVINPY